ncbi:hypothetical protein FBU30_001006 [Linnemannia zychae]|nr:hypothetical protein FBU30_001006 [Linnemannia zychae]
MDRVGLDASLEQSIPHPDTTNTLSNAAAADTPTTTAHSGNSYIYPEGGYGWIVLAATFVCSFWCIGLVFCWGVFQEYLLRMDIFGATSSAKELSWVGSLSCACIFVAAPVIVVLINKFGTAMVLASGVICVTTGFIAASFATTYWHLYITIRAHATDFSMGWEVA